MLINLIVFIVLEESNQTVELVENKWVLRRNQIEIQDFRSFLQFSRYLDIIGLWQSCNDVTGIPAHNIFVLLVFL